MTKRNFSRALDDERTTCDSIDRGKILVQFFFCLIKGHKAGKFRRVHNIILTTTLNTEKRLHNNEIYNFRN